MNPSVESMESPPKFEKEALAGIIWTYWGNKFPCEVSKLLIKCSTSSGVIKIGVIKAHITPKEIIVTNHKKLGGVSIYYL